MIWQNPHILWLLLAIPILLAAQQWYKKRWSKKRKKYFGDSLFNKLYKGFWGTGNRVKNICLYVALFFLITAAAGPKIGTKVENIEREGIELLIALDLSASMKAQDVTPSRLAKAKHEIAQMLKRLKNDRVGLIIFTGSAYLQVPLTMDYGTLHMLLDITKTNQMPNTATDIRSAMELAAKTFADENEKASDKQAAEVLLIISDGENHGDSYKKSLTKLTKQGVTVFTMGVGTKEGGTIPIYGESNKVVGYKRNSKGQIVTTELMPQVLKTIAQKGGGEYYRLGRAGSAVSEFLSDIKSLEKGKFMGKKYASYQNQYRWLTFIGLGFLLISILFPGYRREQE